MVWNRIRMRSHIHMHVLVQKGGGGRYGESVCVRNKEGDTYH